MPSNSAVVDRPETQSAELRTDDAWLAVFGDLPNLLTDLPASWFESAKTADQRSEARCWSDCKARLTPLDPQTATEDAPPVVITLKDISRHGIGFSHSDPLPHRLVRITFGSEESAAPVLVVRLQWCRFRKPGLYESGGRIQRVIS